MVRYTNIATITGIGQNSGKTTFACWLINYLTDKNHVVGAIKISPHLKHADHEQLIFSEGNIYISQENKIGTGKDSSRFKEAGAESVFFVVCPDNYILKTLHVIKEHSNNIDFWIIESGGVNKYITSDLKIKMHGNSVIDNISDDNIHISFEFLSDINSSDIPKRVDQFINQNINRTDDKF